ncbi:MAG: MFS transporter [Planctomycetaceae bacterium]
MSDNKPSLLRDQTFWGLLVTQFLGAFNDNVFKFLVMFLCTDRAKTNPLDDWQGYALIAFASPFVLFSGISGYLGDRFSKTKVIFVSKVLEIVVMGAGLLVFWLTEPSKLQLVMLLGVLFLMGAQSTLFGPAKYGILPELYAKDRLPGINGWFLMTTFVAIIGGVAAAGALKDALPSLVSVQWICVLIAIVGTLTTLPIRKLPAAEPHLKVNPSSLFIDPETRESLRQLPRLFIALIYSSVFWFVGGIFQPSVNALGKLQYGLSDSATGQLSATTAIGIAIGSVLAGYLSRSCFRASLVRVAAIGMVICMAALAIPGEKLSPAAEVLSTPATAAAEATSSNSASSAAPKSEIRPARLPYVSLKGSALLLIGAGLFAGLFSVPLQVYIQAMAPEHLKGRMIGAMNLINWIGIVLSGAFYEITSKILVRAGFSPNAIFGAIAAVILIAAVTFPMRDESLESTAPLTTEN